MNWLKKLLGLGGGEPKPLPVAEPPPGTPAAPAGSKDAFFEAVRSGQLVQVRDAISDDPGRLETRQDGGTPLHHAALMGHRDVVELLLDRGADFEALDDERHAPPIEWANETGQAAIVRLLFSRGASADLHHAASYGLVERVRSAIDEEGADPDEARDLGTPLHWACLWGQPAVVELLIERGVALDAKSRHGQTAQEIIRQHLEDPDRATPILVDSRRAELRAGWTRCAELLRTAGPPD